MAKKNKDIESLGCALLLLIALCPGVFLLFKWLVAGAIAIVSFIIIWAINFKKKKNEEKYFKKWEASLFENSYIRPTKNVDIEELKEKLGFVDTTIYDDLFDSATIEKGKEYVRKQKITKVSIKNNVWSSIVHGRDTYHVKVYMKDDRVKKAECDCPHFHDKKKYCKHIYATLYFVRSSHNIQKVLDSISTFGRQLTQLINLENDFINKHGNRINPKNIDEYMKNTYAFQDNLNLVKKNIDQNSQNEDVMVNSLVSLMQESYKLVRDVEAMLIKSGKIDYLTFNNSSHYSEKSTHDTSTIATGLFAADAWSKSNKSKERDKKLEKEMDIYGLEDWQKEEVRKGNYEPWNFEEEDLEEDDYYYDDSD